MEPIFEDEFAASVLSKRAASAACVPASPDLSVLKTTTSLFSFKNGRVYLQVLLPFEQGPSLIGDSQTASLATFFRWNSNLLTDCDTPGGLNGIILPSTVTNDCQQRWAAVWDFSTLQNCAAFSGVAESPKDNFFAAALFVSRDYRVFNAATNISTPTTISAAHSLSLQVPKQLSISPATVLAEFATNSAVDLSVRLVSLSSDGVQWT